MKRAVILIIILLQLLLCACGTANAVKPNENSANTKEPSAETEATSPEPGATEQSNKSTEELEIAKSYIGKPVSELYKAIGQPESSDYAPSCLGEGEDGNLYYDGFIVYTFKDKSGEKVHDVE
ncbi:MAG: hypothetical protein GX684_06970 [Ruminococcaceae bacterium]|nr:hypothetical protein [Oscillospiraceae bacterium]